MMIGTIAGLLLTQ